MLFNLLDDAPVPTNPTTTYIVFGVIFVAIIGLMIWQSMSNKKKQKAAPSAGAV